MIDCSSLKGSRARSICCGIDQHGNLINMSQRDRLRYLRAFFPEAAEVELIEHLRSQMISATEWRKTPATTSAPCLTCGKSTIPVKSQSRVLSDSGDKILAALKTLTGVEACAACLDHAQRLNSMRVGQVRDQLDSVVDEIYERGMSQLGWADRVLISLDFFGVTKTYLRETITKALESAVDSPRGAKSSTARPHPFTMGPNHPRFISSSQFQKDILSLLPKIPSTVTAICGIARSGLSAASMISMYLHLPLVILRQNLGDFVDAGNGWRLGGTRHVPPNGHVLLVDDTCMTGNSLKAVTPLLKKFERVTTATIYTNPLAKRKPDISAIDLPWPHLLEWNFLNSVISPSLACDFDGVLCLDCPPGMDDDGPKYLDFIRNAKPLYLPRKVPIPLIVTARVEKYRAETMAWLDRHRVQVNRLIMHPATSTRIRERDDVPAYKAKFFSEWAATHRPIPGPTAFVESEDRQAARIHSITGRMVICPASERVYWRK